MSNLTFGIIKPDAVRAGHQGKLIDRITTQCKYFGHLMGVNYAEPFVVKETMAVDDIVTLPIPSV